VESSRLKPLLQCRGRGADCDNGIDAAPTPPEAKPRAAESVMKSRRRMGLPPNRETEPYHIPAFRVLLELRSNRGPASTEAPPWELPARPKGHHGEVGPMSTVGRSRRAGRRHHGRSRFGWSRGQGAVSALDNLFQDRIHPCFVECGQRFSAHIAELAHAQAERGDGLDVGCL